MKLTAIYAAICTVLVLAICVLVGWSFEGKKPEPVPFTSSTPTLVVQPEQTTFSPPPRDLLIKGERWYAVASDMTTRKKSK